MKPPMRVTATMKVKLLLCLLLSGLAACVEPTQEVFCDYGCATPLPSLEEGDGLISISYTSFTDTGDFGYGITLVRCATGRALKVDQFANYEEKTNLQNDVEAFRKQKGLSDVNGFWRMLKDRGYDPRVIQIYSDNKDAAKQCKKFYPRVARPWPDKTAEQLAKEKAWYDYWADPKNIDALIGVTVTDIAGK
jgi:hypothetical protein